MATPLSGKDGTIKIASTAVALVTHWTFEKSVMTDRFADNESAGSKRTIRGTRHGRGTIRGKLDTAAAVTIEDNVSATVLLYVNATEFYSVPCIISNYKVGEVDISEGPAIPYEATFETNGAWTEPTWA